jgi:hypothetical protein
MANKKKSFRVDKRYRWSKVTNNTKTKKLGAELTITMKL